MNGRIYDPKIGRFLQADPHIQAAYNTQSYNRYSYVLNSPLSYTDPSGYFFKKLLGMSIGREGAFGLGLSAGIFEGYATGWAFGRVMRSDGLSMVVSIALNFIPGCQIWCSAAFNASRTYYHTQSLGRAFHAGGRSALTATVFWGIGATFDVQTSGEFFTQGGPGHIFTHALAGGVIADLQGGKFAHGFISAGLTKGLTPQFEGVGGTAFEVGGYNIAEVVIAAVLGGTISKATGGKFANGAITAAMANLFNNQYARLRSREAAMAEARMRNYDQMNLADDAEIYGTVVYQDGESYVVGRSSTDVPFGLVVGETPNDVLGCEGGAVFCFFEGLRNQSFVTVAPKPIENASAIVVTVPNKIHYRSIIESSFMNLSTNAGAPVYVNSFQNRGVIHIFDASKGGK